MEIFHYELKQKSKLQINNIYSIKFSRCCYTVETGALIDDLSIKEYPLTHWYITKKFNDSQVENSDYFNLIRDTAVKNDEEIYDYMCEEDNICSRFLARRPIPDCQKYTAPEQGQLC